MTLNHLERLEAESVHFLREAVAETENPVMLYSAGKSSRILLHLARKAFYPATPPFPLLYLETAPASCDAQAIREEVAAQAGVDLIIYRAPGARESGIGEIKRSGRDSEETVDSSGGAFEQALDELGFRTAISGTRRARGESSNEGRACPLDHVGQLLKSGIAGAQVWRLHSAYRRANDWIHLCPISNWSELDVVQYIHYESIAKALRAPRERQVVAGREALAFEREVLPARLHERRSSLRAVGPVSRETGAERRGSLRVGALGDLRGGNSALISRLSGEAEFTTDESKSGSAPASAGDVDTDGVVYTFFASKKRRFITAAASSDPRHTLGLISAVSRTDLSLIVVDAREAISQEAKRNRVLVALLGVPHVVLVVDEMDSVAYSESRFRELEDEFQVAARKLLIPQVTTIPICARTGDNLRTHSQAMPWYRGPTLWELFDSTELSEDCLRNAPLRLPVQWSSQSESTALSLAGTIVAGAVRVGDTVRVQPSGQVAKVSGIVGCGGDSETAHVGESVSLTVTGAAAVGRGSVISGVDGPAETADQFEATLIWLSEAPLFCGRSYQLKIGAARACATISRLKYRVDVDDLSQRPAQLLAANEIGVCNLQLDAPIAFDPYEVNHDTGGFILTDASSRQTIAVGMLRFALRRAQNVHWQAVDVSKQARAGLKRQRACLLWYTGLSGAGKSTIANLVDRRLHSLRQHSYLLDGDNVRHGLNRDLGFTVADRVENIRRIAEVSKLMVDAGLIVGTAFISPFRAERRMARALLEGGEFIEIFVSTPLAVAEERDPKGLYKKARSGQLQNFTGIDSPYEVPESPELTLDTTILSAEECAEVVISFLHRKGILDCD